MRDWSIKAPLSPPSRCDVSRQFPPSASSSLCSPRLYSGVQTRSLISSAWLFISESRYLLGHVLRSSDGHPRSRLWIPVLREEQRQSALFSPHHLHLLLFEMLTRFSSSSSLQTASFTLTAASVSSNLNLAAQVSIDAYGISALNWTINLCDVLGGVLCPLPEISFSGESRSRLEINHQTLEGRSRS